MFHKKLSISLFQDNCNFPNSEDLLNKPMKPEHFHKIEKELHDQMLFQHKQNIEPKIDLWNTCFESRPHTLSFGKNFESETEEEQFYSLSDAEGNLSQMDQPSSFQHGGSAQGLVQKVSEAGIVPLSIPTEARNGSSCDIFLAI